MRRAYRETIEALVADETVTKRDLVERLVKGGHLAISEGAPRGPRRTQHERVRKTHMEWPIDAPFSPPCDRAGGMPLCRQQVHRDDSLFALTKDRGAVTCPKCLQYMSMHGGVEGHVRSYHDKMLKNYRGVAVVAAKIGAYRMNLDLNKARREA